MKSFQLAATVIFATTTMAMAQDSVKISFSGDLLVERLSEDGSEYDYFYGNGDVRFRWTTATDIKFGADLGIETYRTLSDDLSDDMSAHYAAGVVEGQFGKVSIGMPRSVMSNYFSIPAISGSKFLESSIGFVGYDIVRYVKLHLGEGEGDLYGARYDGRIGKIDVAASISKFSYASGNIAEVVSYYNAGLWSVTLGTAFFEQEGDSVENTSLEVQGHSGKISGGFLFSRFDETLLGDGVYEAFISRAFVSYDVNDELKLNTQVLNYQIGEELDERVYSFDFSYQHNTGALINAGITAEEAFSDKIFSISFGYEF
jgi:hypothetical protein